MGIKREEFQALIERESVSDFIWTRSWRNIEGTEIGLFELANDRWGVIFSITPPYYVSNNTEEKLEAFFKINLPEESSIQLFTFASKNIDYFKNHYLNIHNNPSNVGNEEALRELTQNKEDWMKKYKNQSLFSDKGYDVRLRNFVNLVCVTIPVKNENNIEYTESEVINIFSRVYTSLQDFNARKFTQVEYVNLMRELLVPDAEALPVTEDKMTYLNTQVVDNNSVIVLEEDSDSLGIGTMISKEEYKNLLADEHIILSEKEEEDKEDKEEKSFFQKLFEKKKDAIEEQEFFTKYHAKVLTTKMYPSHVSLFEMLSKFVDFFGRSVETDLPAQFFASLTIYIEERDKLKNAVFQKTAWNLHQTSTIGDKARYFPAIVERAQESEAINRLLSKGDVPMSAMWSLAILDDSLKKVNQYSERLQKNFNKMSWILQEESIIHHWIYLYSLPLQFEPFILKHTSRLNTLFTSNCAAISPIMTGSTSIGEPVLIYVDRSSQLVGADIFSSETNYNFLVVGTSGSGKSYMMADFVTNYLMTGAKVRIIDVGKSYKTLNKILKGQYIEFTESDNMCLNFFTEMSEDKKTGNISGEDIQIAIDLVALMARQSLNENDSNMDNSVVASYLSQSIQHAWNSQRRNAGMADVLNALEKIKSGLEENNSNDNILNNLITALYAFGNVKGEYYSYFNGINNVNFNNDFVVLELEALDRDPHLKSVALAAITTVISKEFFDPMNKEQRKLLIVDEAWSIMDNKNIIRFLETMSRRIRKHNGALGIITQKLSDFFKNEATRAIFSTSENKIFLKQDLGDIDTAEQEGNLGLDSSEFSLMRTLQSKAPLYSEVMFKQSGSFLIGRLMTDRSAHWIYTNHPRDQKTIYNLMMEKNISELDARIIKGYSQKNNSTIEEEFNKRAREGLLNEDLEAKEDIIKQIEEIEEN